MEISYNFRFSDYRALAKAMRTPLRRRISNLAFWSIFAINLAVAAFYLVNAQERGRSDIAGPLAAGVTVGLLVLRYFLEPWALGFNYKRFGLDGKHITVRLEEEAFSASEVNAQSRIHWSGVKRYSQLPTHAFVWIYKLQAVIIPFDAFPDDAKRGEFLSFVESKVSLTN